MKWPSSLLALVLLAACSAAPTPSASAPPNITLYTSVTQNTVDEVVNGFKAANPGANVEVFRATTGNLNARIAGDQRTGGVQADVIWGTDPLSMQSYAAQGFLRAKPITAPDGIPSLGVDQLYATRVLHVVIVAAKGVPVADWPDLAGPAVQGSVAVPDPAAAGSALAALGHFGVDYYRTLKDNGAAQVATVPEVITTVAEGRYKAGITLDSEVRAAITKGSPVQLVWPSSGAVAVYSPIAATTREQNRSGAEKFLSYVLSADGQKAIAKTGWQPVLPGVAGPPKPEGAKEINPDWTELFGKQQEVLKQYQALFGK
ncbi:extracellular solute-binding protein [Lentzea tibetensis]|uniref:Extracellular solute-binding protein n=1 Tax=Lentzea tibetensis TaxID=2591470 RepID=A0A563F2P4_9PSEU|nr:extracellular solute-binding protein [Lentzea tibetensis]TWP54230.1 extracellular solute-binding protein [Lentzea tibetensis]